MLFRYARPERMDVYRTEFNPNLYIHPQNSHYFEERGYWALSQVTPSTVESFKPPINSSKLIVLFYLFLRVCFQMSGLVW